jgi:hypothetical protein
MDELHELRARIAGIFFGILFAAIGIALAIMLGIEGWWIAAFAAAGGVVAGLFIHRFIHSVLLGAGEGFLAFLWPSGKSTPYAPSYSLEQSLAARGDVQGALDAYEEAIAANPEDPEPRVQAAEQYRLAGNARRSAELLREVRRMPGLSRGRELYVTQRLIDLYLGSLGDDGRAVVELRRLVERFPGTPEERGAREALARIKQERR